MDSKTFYRKYRPQSLSELDLVDIQKGLIDLAKSKKIPHALLFTGPRGTGKTSAARILAKTLNCTSKKTHEPCNHCQICKSITNGTALDLIEIDAASNRGIDDIRALRERIKLSPAASQYKVYIIDEVHMLTTEAFNALLKTLEEPPQHAVFILCTTEPEKLPETIISRCLRFNFQKANQKEIIGSLKRVIRAEKLKPEKEVLEKISQAVDGSFRDAHKLLEQLSLKGKKIGLLQTKKLLQQTEKLSPQKLLKLLTAKDIKKSLLEVQRITNAGGDLAVYTNQLLSQLRLEMLANVGLQGEQRYELSLFEIKKLINLFSQAHRELKFSPIPQLNLELAVVEFCGETQPKKTAPPKPTIPSKPILKPGDLKKIKANWEKILAEVKPLNHSVQALLRASRPVSFDGTKLTIEVFYKFHKEKLQQEKCRQIVEQAASQVLQTPIRLDCVLGEKKKKEDKKEDIVQIAQNIFKV